MMRRLAAVLGSLLALTAVAPSRRVLAQDPATTTATQGRLAAATAVAAAFSTPTTVAINVQGVREGQTLQLEYLRSDRSMWERRSQRGVSSPGEINLADDVSGLPRGTRVQWRVVIADASGARSLPRLSNVLTIGGTTTAPTSGMIAQAPSTSAPSTISVSPGAGAGAASGDVTVRMAAPSTLRVASTASLAGAVGSGSARWLSLDESIATVDASGTVTARAAGSAQLLAIARAADGAVRVTLVPVQVTP